MAMLAALTWLGGTRPAMAGEDAEAQLQARVNDERRAYGLAPLGSAEDLVVVARSHGEDMARTGQLRHNDRLQEEVSGWRRLAENVGMGHSVDQLHAALMASARHRVNILGPHYSEIGVGVARSGGVLWVTQVFRQPMVPPAAASSSLSLPTSDGPAITATAAAPIPAVAQDVGAPLAVPGPVAPVPAPSSASLPVAGPVLVPSPVLSGLPRPPPLTRASHRSAVRPGVRHETTTVPWQLVGPALGAVVPAWGLRRRRRRRAAAGRASTAGPPSMEEDPLVEEPPSGAGGGPKSSAWAVVTVLVTTLAVRWVLGRATR